MGIEPVMVRNLTGRDNAAILRRSVIGAKIDGRQVEGLAHIHADIPGLVARGHHILEGIVNCTGLHLVRRA